MDRQRDRRERFMPVLCEHGTTLLYDHVVKEWVADGMMTRECALTCWQRHSSKFVHQPVGVPARLRDAVEAGWFAAHRKVA